MDLVAPFGVRCALAGLVSFVDNGAVKDVAAQGKMQVVLGVVGEAERLHGGEGVYCCEDCVWGLEGRDGWWWDCGCEVGGHGG